MYQHAQKPIDLPVRCCGLCTYKSHEDVLLWGWRRALVVGRIARHAHSAAVRHVRGFSVYSSNAAVCGVVVCGCGGAVGAGLFVYEEPVARG